MKIHELLTDWNNVSRTRFSEDFASHFSTQVPDFSPQYSKIAGTMDGQDVWVSRCWKDNYVFAFREGEECFAFIVISEFDKKDRSPLVRSWTSRSGKGYVTALIGFVTQKLKLKLIITKEEGLTSQGLKWISSLIKNGKRQFKLTDQFGQDLDAGKLEIEWNESRKTGSSSDLEIFIENNHFLPLWGKGYRSLTEAARYVNDEQLE